jgi:hypothetical protein
MRANPSFLFFILATCVASVLTSGCATQQQPMYYWGGYSNSLYCCRKDSTEENLLKHKQILENIVEESAKRNLRVPPGVCAELGYIYFRQNNSQEAIKYFELEERTYPESKVLMQRLTQATKARTDPK